MTRPLRIIFMGTPDFALASLQSLFLSNHEIVAVYCQPPKEKGRGYKVQENPTHIFAKEKGIPVYTPSSFRSEEAIDLFKSHNADIAVVVAYGLLLPKEILDIPPLGCVNIHGSLLPRWRGAAPIQRSIMEGDKVTGITTMFMDEGLDTGPMLEWESVDILESTTTLSLYNDLSILGAKLILSTINGLSDGTLKSVCQPTEGITYAKKLEKKEGHLDFSLSATILDRMIRGLVPQISVWCCFGSLNVKIIKVKPSAFKFDAYDFGTIVQKDYALYIVCGEGSLEVLILQPEGSKAMAVDVFLRGYRK
ncbi:MAG: Methionyl-tRNA formyltransferase [Holosporales bacterium]